MTGRYATAGVGSARSVNGLDVLMLLQHRCMRLYLQPHFRSVVGFPSIYSICYENRFSM
jgi:hypothetical protein